MEYNSTISSYRMPTVLSGSALKVIAVLSMVADHSAYYFLEENTVAYGVMRCFGRIAFPVFALLVAEGYAYTRNRMRYFLSLLAFAAISEVPWCLLNGADGTHNVMFTLALGVAAMAAFDRLKEHRTVAFVTILLAATASAIFGLDYGWRGIMMIFLFHLFGNLYNRQRSNSQSARLLQLAFAFPFTGHYGITGALLACSIIFLYDGTRGFIKGNLAKYGFYAFYPLHLLLIWGLI